MKTTCVAVAIAVLATGCTGSARPVSNASPHPRSTAAREVLFGFDSSVGEGADVEGTRLVRLDPVSLRPLVFSTLRLGDTTTGHVSSPDHNSLALGTMNDRQIVVVDLVGYRVAARYTVARPASFGWPPGVFAVAWPRADRLVAYTEPFAAHVAYPARLVVIDPAAHRVVRTEPLGGSVVATAALPGNRTGFLVAAVDRARPARLVIVEPDGRSRAVTLPETAAGPSDAPAVAVVGEDVYVVGDSDRVAVVDPASGRVAYHAVPGLLADRVPDGPPVEPGSGGIMSADYRSAGSLGPGLLAVGGYQVRPARHATENQSTVLSEQIVDTKTWTVRRTLHGVVDVVAAHGLYYCWVGTALFRPSVLVALRPDGTVAFRRTTPDAGWQISAGRLFETRGDAGDRELDPLTGRVLHRVSLPGGDPVDLLPWTAPAT